MRKLLVLIGLLLTLPALAQSASTTFSVTFNSPPSTSVACVANGPFSIPVAAGTTVGQCTVQPTNWTGGLAVTPGAPSFVPAATAQANVWNVNVGASGYNTPGTVTFNVTATP